MMSANILWPSKASLGPSSHTPFRMCLTWVLPSWCSCPCFAIPDLPTRSTACSLSSQNPGHLQHPSVSLETLSPANPVFQVKFYLESQCAKQIKDELLCLCLGDQNPTSFLLPRPLHTSPSNSSWSTLMEPPTPQNIGMSFISIFYTLLHNISYLVYFFFL